MPAETVIYEQPLNEHIRVCLRLEHLFRQAKHFLEQQSSWHARLALSIILDILDVIDRPDLKSKLGNALQTHSSSLTNLERVPNIDRDKLHSILDKLFQYKEMLHNIHGKLGQELRDNEFLAAIKQRIHTPGGACDFSLPIYQLWQQQPLEQQYLNIHNWFDNFEQLQKIVTLLLQLTRDSTIPGDKTAVCGFYQESLASDLPYQMVRVIIPINVNSYPEISVGRHRLSIHFYKFGILERPTQVTNNMEFKLACCKL